MQEELYRENYPIVYGYLLSLCADPTQAEDLAAEVFYRALKHPERFDGSCKLSTWLCAIGRNLFIDTARRKKRLDRLHRELPLFSRSLEELYAEKDLARRILSCARALPSPRREVFFMRLEGLSFQQIGLALGKTENWARVTYYRIKNQIIQETEAK